MGPIPHPSRTLTVKTINPKLSERMGLLRWNARRGNDWQLASSNPGLQVKSSQLTDASGLYRPSELSLPSRGHTLYWSSHKDREVAQIVDVTCICRIHADEKFSARSEVNLWQFSIGLNA